jgi:hypothetical protein
MAHGRYCSSGCNSANTIKKSPATAYLSPSATIFVGCFRSLFNQEGKKQRANIDKKHKVERLNTLLDGFGPDQKHIFEFF